MFEKVNPCHPDKVADRIAGALVDLAYRKETNPRIAVEVLIGHGVCHIIAETSVSIPLVEVTAAVHRIAGNLAIDFVEVPQDGHLADNQADGIRCGDNGIFKGMPVTPEQKTLSQIARDIFSVYPHDGKYILDGDRLILCQSNAPTDALRKLYPDAEINPLGDWTGGTDVDTGATNRKLGSDMADSVTGGGLHGKDLSKADVSVKMAVFTSDSYDGRYMQLSISESADAVSNTSTLYWTLSSIGGSSTYYTIDATTVTINGTQVYYKARTAWDDRVFPAAKGSVSGSISVPHNSDGTKTVTVVFSTRVYIFGSLDYGGSMTLTSLDRTAPTVSCSVGSITANGFKITASSSATADIWHYSINGGTSWTQFSTTAGTSASVTLSSLSPSTTYSVRVQARKRSNQVYGSSGTVYAKTLGGAVINSCTTVTADASSVSLTMNVTVYNAAYSNYVTIKNGSTTVVSFAAQSWAVGTANRTITLTSDQRTALLNAMPDVKSLTATVELVTKNGTEQIGNASAYYCVIQTTEANSAPTMTSFSVRDSRTTTVAVTGNSQRFIQGYSYVYVTPGTATAKNGASIVKYAASATV